MAQTATAEHRDLTKITKIVGVKMPNRPQIDKIVALNLISIFLTRMPVEITSAEYWTSNEGTEEELRKLEEEGIYPIDIGERKYHRIGFPSAASYVVWDLELELSPGAQDLVKLVDANNVDGSAKSYPFSVAKLVRDMYELDDTKDGHIAAINAASHVVECYILAEDEVAMRPKFNYEVEVVELAKALPDLANRLTVCNNLPLTLGRYLMDLWVLGTDIEEMRARVSYWLERKDKLSALYQGGKAALAAMNLEEIHQFRVGEFAGAVLEIEDRYLLRAIIKQKWFAVRLMKRATGHVAIATMKELVDLSQLAKYLERKEPGRWYYQKTSGTLLNGSVQYTGVEPTSLTTEQLVDFIDALARFPAPKPRTKKHAGSGTEERQRAA